ncbi:MAG: hypothetical protein OEN02_02475 [Gammaproteobacteria bacterium]|nr:hypothetical protein [Gammaproteobacteria bacterium]MDH3534528.1 hypothetical protein [Gammaproteobacteria bacterium]
MDKDQQLQQAIKKTLDRQATDPETRNALRAARIAALAGETRGGIPRWVSATAFASLAMVAVAVLIGRGIDDIEMLQLPADELVVISSDDELELFEELEFYVWFDQDKNV